MAARAAINESEEDSYGIKEKICGTFTGGSARIDRERMRSGGRDRSCLKSRIKYGTGTAGCVPGTE